MITQQSIYLGKKRSFLGNNSNTMSAFWSGTDDTNENYPQFYGVMGKVSTKPEYKFRYALGKEKFDCELWELFEKPQVTMKEVVTINIPGVADYQDEQEVKDLEFTGPWPMVEYPDDWMGQHSKSWSPSKSYGTYGSGGYGGAWSRTSYGGADTWADGHGLSAIPGGNLLGTEINEAFPGSGDFGYGGGTRQGQEWWTQQQQEQVEGFGTNSFKIAEKQKTTLGELNTDNVTVKYLLTEEFDAADLHEVHSLVKDFMNFGFFLSVVDIARDEHLVE